MKTGRSDLVSLPQAVLERPRWRRLLLAGIAALALLLRLAYLLARGDLAAPPEFDGIGYDMIARNLLAGEGFVLDGRLTAFRPPGYPLFVALIYTMGGGWAALRVIQAILGAATALVTYQVARLAFSQVRLALAAALFMALHPVLVYLTGLIYPETLAVLLIALALWLLMLLAAEPSPRAGLLLAFGGLLAAVVLLRPGLLIFAVLAIGWLGITRRTRARSDATLKIAAAVTLSGSTGQSAPRHAASEESRSRNRDSSLSRLCSGSWRSEPLRTTLLWAVAPRAAWASVLLTLLGLVLLVLPWTARNYWVFGQFIPIATEGGVTFWGGNHPLGHGGHVEPSAATWLGLDPPQSLYGWPGLTEKESEGRFYRAALDWIAREPDQFLRLLPQKLARAWMLVFGNEARPVDLPRWISAAYLLYPLSALVGLLLSLSHWKRLAPLYCLLIAHTLTTLLFYGSTRQTALAAPAALVLSAFAVDRGVTIILGRFRNLKGATGRASP